MAYILHYHEVSSCEKISVQPRFSVGALALLMMQRQELRLLGSGRTLLVNVKLPT